MAHRRRNPRELQKVSLRFMDSLKTIQMGGVTFYLTWVSILMTHGHFCSMHLYGKDWYFYDDDSDGGLTRTCLLYTSPSPRD